MNEKFAYVEVNYVSWFLTPLQHIKEMLFLTDIKEMAISIMQRMGKISMFI